MNFTVSTSSVTGFRFVAIFLRAPSSARLRRSFFLCIDLVDVESDEPFVITVPSWETDIWCRPLLRKLHRGTARPGGGRALGFPDQPVRAIAEAVEQRLPAALMLRIERTALDRVLIDELGRAPKCDELR